MSKSFARRHFNHFLPPTKGMLGRQLNEARRAAAGPQARRGSDTPVEQQGSRTDTSSSPDAGAPRERLASNASSSDAVESLRVQLRELNMQKAQLLQTVSGE